MNWTQEERDKATREWEAMMPLNSATKGKEKMKRAGLYGTQSGHITVDAQCLVCSGTGLKMASTSRVSCAVLVCDCVAVSTGFGPARYTLPRKLQTIADEPVPDSPALPAKKEEPKDE